jgi:hypothetical protein
MARPGPTSAAAALAAASVGAAATMAPNVTVRTMTRVSLPSVLRFPLGGLARDAANRAIALMVESPQDVEDRIEKFLKRTKGRSKVAAVDLFYFNLRTGERIAYQVVPVAIYLPPARSSRLCDGDYVAGIVSDAMVAHCRNYRLASRQSRERALKSRSTTPEARMFADAHYTYALMVSIYVGALYMLARDERLSVALQFEQRMARITNLFRKLGNAFAMVVEAAIAASPHVCCDFADCPGNARTMKTKCVEDILMLLNAQIDL